MLAKSKLNSIESLVSKALIDMEISHEKYNTILKKKRYEKTKEHARIVSEKLEEEEKQENIRLNSIGSRTAGL